MKTPILIYLVILTAIFVQAVIYYPILPQIIASHFNSTGTPNRWTSKESFFALEFLILGTSAALFIGLPWLLEKSNVQKMNLPNREYWLAPERIRQTYLVIRRKMCWFGIANTLLTTLVIQMVIRAALRPAGVLDSQMFMLLLATYFLFVIIWLISFYRRFAKTD